MFKCWHSTFWEYHNIPGSKFCSVVFEILYLPTLCTVEFVSWSLAFWNPIHDGQVFILADISILILDCAHPIHEAGGVNPFSSLQITVAHFQMLFEASCMLSRHWGRTIHHYLQISNRKTTLRSRLVSLMLVLYSDCLHHSLFSSIVEALIPFLFAAYIYCSSFARVRFTKWRSKPERLSYQGKDLLLGLF